MNKSKFLVVPVLLLLAGCLTMEQQAARTAENTCAHLNGTQYQECFNSVAQQDYARRAQAQAIFLGALGNYHPQPPPQPQGLRCMSHDDGFGRIYTRCY